MKLRLFFIALLGTVSVAFADAPFSLGPSELPAPTSQPATAPVNVSSGWVEYMATRLEAHEPIYFLYWPDTPDVKFQISLKYRLLGDTSPVFGSLTPSGSSFYLAYTQTTLWNISGESQPIWDTTYNPELFYQFEDKEAGWMPGLSHFVIQSGFSHESNGKDGGDSRSMNYIYVKPIYTFGDPGNRANSKGNFFISVAPKLWFYVSDTEPEDLKDYRGYGDLEIKFGERGGIQLSIMGRTGEGWENQAIQFDASCPLSRLGIKNPDFYLYAQYFLGYGESLLEYDESGSSFRVGLALVR